MSYLHHTISDCQKHCISGLTLVFVPVLIRLVYTEQLLGTWENWFRPELPNLSLLSWIVICLPHRQILMMIHGRGRPAVISHGLVLGKCLFD